MREMATDKTRSDASTRVQDIYACDKSILKYLVKSHGNVKYGTKRGISSFFKSKHELENENSTK